MSAKAKRLSLLFPVTAAVVVVLDRITKWWVSNAIEIGGSWPQTGFFRITHGENTGAAFGMMQNSRVILSIISSLGVVAVLYIALVLSKRFSFLTWKTTMFALGLVLGGTLGNLIDRAVVGHVTDFIKVWEWPDFNIADSSLVIGGILLAFNLIRANGTEENNGSANSAHS
jgi:lipoprotein signal peptidase